jgi:hypothetical protein
MTFLSVFIPLWADKCSENVMHLPVQVNLLTERTKATRRVWVVPSTRRFSQRP